MRSSIHQRRIQNGATGFTLVELLVALGLVSLLMLMFAQVFQVATGTMSTQRGIMENDQRARSITTIITDDLGDRSMRHVLPYQPGETPPNTSSLYPEFCAERFAAPHGFLSISENSDNDQSEDVLHFTVNTDGAPYFGKATQLIANLSANPNQPDADDEDYTPNSTGYSSMAEIVYFLRNGNLYRRVLLLRDQRNGSAGVMNAQPRAGADGRGTELFDPSSGNYALGRDFWNEFDFSGRMSTATSGIRFPGDGLATNYYNPLDNSGGSISEYYPPFPGNFPLAVPLNRFGHNPDFTSANGSGTGASVGNPREFLDSGSFIGRFTQEETSHSKFNFPHSLSSDVDDHDTTTGIPGTLLNDGNPMKMAATTNPLSDSDGDGVVDQFARGPRRGEDILLTNVHDFDVKVWDEVIGDHVDLGHTRSNSGGVNGDFHQNRNRRQSYGPQSTGNRMFDTWHPWFNANNDGAVDLYDVPPFLPKYSYSTWSSTATYTVGDIVIPNSSTDPNNRESLGYRCVVAGAQGATEPAWPSPGIVDQYVADGAVTWQTIYNLKRLKSIKITIRYLDVTSDQMRQVTLIQSLLE